ncbi:hypothetical protein [Novosphingobium sp. Gsoil 351]|uniref:hypothetical protein n=1 Tax=Novosphingobium sp. Gsoil 351 TaxID=2675225 RepID=UPI0012B4F1BF|nr:hypothetical protein [Novosphingobium sp. Gsoil 351]QGN55790.1 hypothetical protein GKE62_15785 [Novosphingobium sp. Gsoil 351]
MSTALILAALVAAFLIAGLLISEHLCRNGDHTMPWCDNRSAPPDISENANDDRA